MDMNNENINLSSAVRRYLTDELGFPEDNIGLSPFVRKDLKALLSFSMTVYGEPIAIVEAKNKKETELLLEKEKLHFKANLQKTPYFLLTNGKNHFWFESSSGNKLKQIPKYELEKDIIPIHERILLFLEKERKKDKGLTYKLRTKNNNNRLEKGFWFLGNENYLVVSFWDGMDWKNKTPNIYLTCEPSGKFSLVFTSRDSSVKADFLRNLASIIPGFKQKKTQGESIAYWEKILSYPEDRKPFLDVLDEFLKTDKKIIDTFISNEVELKKKDLDGINFVPPKDFNKNLRRIKDYRKNIENIPQHKGRVNRNGQTKNNELYPLLLKELRLQNIGHFRNLTLDLDYKIICLLGENGIGKSTILRAILLSLIGVNETSEIDTTHKKLQQLLRITGQSKGVPVFVPSGYIQIKYNYEKPYTNRIDFEKIEDELEVKITDISEPNSNSFGATNGNLLNNLVIGFSQVQSRENKEVDNNSLPKEAHVRDVLPLLYDEADNRFQELADWIINLHAASINNEVGKKVIDFIFEVVSDIVGESVLLKEVNHLNKLLWVQLNSKDAILFHLISQGFKNVFAWVGHFMKRLAEANDYVADFMNKPAILLIDEIDTYLHPKWQKNILRVLADKFPNTQIIVTTHSPLVASHLPTESKAVYIIKENEVIPIKHIYGKEISSIFYQWMGVKQRPIAVQNKINLLFVELEKENMEAAKKIYEELRKDLGEDDLDLTEAKSYMELVEN